MCRRPGTDKKSSEYIFSGRQQTSLSLSEDKMLADGLCFIAVTLCKKMKV